MSRTDYPKQFLDILGTGKTLIQQTFERYNKLVPAENIYVVTAKEYVPIVKKQLVDIPEDNILVGSAADASHRHQRLARPLCASGRDLE